MIQIKDIMHEDVITISRDETIMKAIEVMAEKEISCLVITSFGKPTGVITQRDILEKVILEGFKPEENLIGSYMTAELITIERDDDLVVAVNKMMENDVKHLPVVHSKKLVGIVTQTDVTFDTYNKLNISDYIELMNSVFKARQKEKDLGKKSFG